MTSINAQSDNSWLSRFNPLEQNQIATALGCASTADVPALTDLKASALVMLQGALAPNLMVRVFTAIGLEKAATPVLEEPEVDPKAAEFGERLLKIMVLMSLIEELQSANAKDSMKVKEDQIKQKTEERLEKLKEAHEKMEKAKKSGLFMKIFGWVAMVVAVVVAAVAAVVSGGAAAPLIGLAVAGIACAIMVMEETGAMDAMLNCMFGDNDKAKMGFRLGLNIALIIASIATLGAGFASSASNAASTGAQVGAKAADTAIKAMASTAQTVMKASTATAKALGTGTELAAKVSELAVKAATAGVQMVDKMSKLEKLAEMVQRVGAFIQAGVEVASGVTQGVNAYYQFDAAMARAEVVDVEALLALLDKLMEELMTFYQDMVTNVEDAKGKLGDAMQAYQNASMSILGSSGA